MEISKRLKEILQVNMNNPVTKAFLDLSNNKLKFINNIGYLDVALGDPKNISYITEDRVVYFKKRPLMMVRNSIIFLKSTSDYKYDCDPYDKGCILVMDFVFDHHNIDNHDMHIETQGGNDFYIAIGIRHDETSRITFGNRKVMYPLATLNPV